MKPALLYFAMFCKLTCTFRVIKTSSDVVCFWIHTKIATMPPPHIAKVLTSIRITAQTPSHYYLHSISLYITWLPKITREWKWSPSWNPKTLRGPGHEVDLQGPGDGPGVIKIGTKCSRVSYIFTEALWARVRCLAHRDERSINNIYRHRSPSLAIIHHH